MWRSWWWPTCHGPWHTFHGPVISPYILKTIGCRNVIPGILVACEPVIDLEIYLGQCDLYKQLYKKAGNINSLWNLPYFLVLFFFQVIVTSLKLEVKEIEEIYENGKVEGSKTVLINYSVPLDILQKADRKILYEVLFRLSETVVL